MNIKLPDLMYMNNKQDLPGREFIQYTKYPFHTAEVIWLNNEGDEMRFTTENEGGIYTNITGYRIYLVWRGTITGKLPVSQDTTDHINNFILKAANYYYENRILNNAGRYKRFAVGSGTR